MFVITTAATPNTAAPVKLTTPAPVYAFGTYWRRRLRGVDNETMNVAIKNEIYRLADDAIHRIAGNVGLKDGAIPEYPGEGMLGIGMTGGCDCGPCGVAFSRASRDVESSIVYS